MEPIRLVERKLPDCILVAFGYLDFYWFYSWIHCSRRSFKGGTNTFLLQTTVGCKRRFCTLEIKVLICTEKDLIESKGEIADAVKLRLGENLFQCDGNERLRMVFDLQTHLAFLGEAVMWLHFTGHTFTMSKIKCGPNESRNPQYLYSRIPSLSR